MMGYAKQGQNTAGIHTRLYARAFVIEVITLHHRTVFQKICISYDQKCLNTDEYI